MNVSAIGVVFQLMYDVIGMADCSQSEDVPSTSATFRTLAHRNCAGNYKNKTHYPV